MRGFDVHLDPDLDEEAAYATEGVENRCGICSAHAESLHVVSCIAHSLAVLSMQSLPPGVRLCRAVSETVHKRLKLDPGHNDGKQGAVAFTIVFGLDSSICMPLSHYVLLSWPLTDRHHAAQPTACDAAAATAQQSTAAHGQ